MSVSILQKLIAGLSLKNIASIVLFTIIFAIPSISHAQDIDTSIDSLLIIAWENRFKKNDIAQEYLNIVNSYAQETGSKSVKAKYTAVQLLFDILHDSLPEQNPLGATGVIANLVKKVKVDSLYRHPIFIFYDIAIDKNEDSFTKHIDDWKLLELEEKDQQMLFKFVFSKVLNSQRKGASFILGEHMKAVDYAVKNNIHLIAYAGLRDIAQVFGRVQNHQKSIYYYEQLLAQYYKHPQELGKYHRYLEGDTYYRIGTQYLRMGAYREAVDAINKAYPLIIQRKKSVAALALRFQGGAYEKLAEYDSAIMVYNQAINIFDSLNSKGNYIGTIYSLAGANFLKGDYTASNKTYWTAIRKWEAHGDIGAAAYGYYCLGRNHVTMRNLDSAKLHLSYARGKIRKQSHRADIARLLSQIFEEKGDTKQALYYYKQHNLYMDSLDQSALRKEVMYAENRNLLDKKQQELQQAQLKQQNQKYIMYATGIAALLLLGFAISITISLRQKKKDNKKLLTQQQEITEQNTEIQAQNEELYQQAEELQVQREYLEEQKKEIEKAYSTLERSNTNIKASIETALTIQSAILPNTSYLQEILGEHFVLYRPKDVVSGDFYWATKRGDKTFIAVVDCTGHGVPGAFMSLIGFSLLNRIIKERKVYSPAAILQRLDKAVKKMLKDDTFEHLHGMDMSLIVLEKNGSASNKKITYAGAKNDLYYFNKEQNEMQKLEATRKTIAGFSNREFEEVKVCLASGSKVYMFTDGYPDQNNSKRKSFGKKNFLESLKNSTCQPLAAQRETLDNELVDFMEGEPQRDDITLLGFEI